MTPFLHPFHSFIIPYLLTLSITFISSCREDAEGIYFDPDTAYMVAMVGDEFMSFDFGITAHQNDSYSLAMTGSTNDINEANQSLQLVMFNSSSPITTQTYHVDGKEALVLVTYSSFKKKDRTLGIQKDYTASTSSDATMDHFTVSVAELTESYVKGTFSGTVVVQTETDTTLTLAITEGEFLAPLK